jgi:hypothetical protein
MSIRAQQSASNAKIATDGSPHMLVRLLQLGLGVLAAITTVSAVAQPITQAEAARAIQSAHTLASQIRGFHRGPSAWAGNGPLPAGYCRIMSRRVYIEGFGSSRHQSGSAWLFWIVIAIGKSWGPPR